MALEIAKEIIIRLATDKEFRDKFFNPKNIDKVLSQYKGRLTEEEVQCLHELTSGRVEQYVSKVVFSCSDIRF